MKILLLGEFSSLHRYLKEGLEALGHEVYFAASTDGWKGISGQDFLFKDTEGPLQSIKDSISFVFKLGKFDVIQLITSRIFTLYTNYFLIKYLKTKTKCLSLCAAGTDYYTLKCLENGNLEYGVEAFDPSIKLDYSNRNLRGCISILNGKYVPYLADVIIPSLYEYSISYKKFKTLYNVIGFPINYDKINYQNNEVKGKVVFFHGLNRELAKGTPIIRRAFAMLQDKYQNEVEIIVKGHMPFDKYLDVISKTNVVVDQCCDYGYGINACVSMAQGKVVLSGCRKETLDALNIESTPMILAKPDSNFLFKQMEKIIENKAMIPKIGFASCQYIKQHHDYKMIAKQYIEAWKSTGKV